MSDQASRSGSARPRGLRARLTARIVRLQQRSPVAAILFGTAKKFSDDQGGYLAGLIAYFGFASLLPLLLALVAFLDLVASEEPGFRNQLLHSALSQYPGVASELRASAHGLGATGFAIATALVFTIYSAHRFARAVQNAMNTAWGVPRYRRPRFPMSLVRSFGLIGVLGPGLIATVTLSGIASGIGELGGAGSRILAVCVSLLLNVGLFWLGFRIATDDEIPGRDLRLCAILAAVSWEVLQLVGGYFFSHQLKSNSAYGAFGIVLGLLAWLFLQAQLTLYLVELGVVRARNLWPRTAASPASYADIRSSEMAAQATLTRPELEVIVRRRAVPVTAREPSRSR